MTVTLCTLLLAGSAVFATKLSSSKRGLIAIASDDFIHDNIWTAANSDLTWYYDYAAEPTSNIDSSKLQYVPMMWGAGPNYSSFYDTVKGLLDGGMNINYVLGFNEPDGCSYGGSCVDPATAAHTWKQEIQPLKEMGVQLGAPAVTGSPSGFTWLQDFYTHCAGECTTDFIPVHWYGNFEGMASHIGQVRATYLNMSMWITEFAEANVSLEESQMFYNQSVGFLDQLSYVTHYSYFGSFRSDVSNIGPNAAMLNKAGALTDIGAWYLGKNATGVAPESGRCGVARVAPISWTTSLLAAAICMLVS